MRYQHSSRFRRLLRDLPARPAVARLSGRILPPLDRFVFRLTRGRHTVASFGTGLPIIVLESTGARSGRVRLTPLLGIPDGDDVYVIASNWGRDHHPGWYHNLRAEPTATITVSGERRRVRAREVTGPERERRWRQALAYYPAWSAYERRAGDRVIPLLVLEPDR